MSFLSPPKQPIPPTPANPPATPQGAKTPIPAIGSDPYTGPNSLISTSSSGLKRKATVSRVSLIGG